MRRILLLCSMLILAGCASVPKVTPLADADSWTIPIVPAKVEPMEDAQGTETENAEEPEVFITVPASDKPTKIELKRKPRTAKQQIREMLSNTPAYELKSDNKGVKANQPKKTVWWRWVVAGGLGLLLIYALVMALMKRVANWSPGGFISKMFRRKL